jgi:hypothetical protein
MEAGDHAGEQERDPDGRAGHLSGSTQQREDARSDHRAYAMNAAWRTDNAALTP